MAAESTTPQTSTASARATELPLRPTHAVATPTMPNGAEPATHPAQTHDQPVSAATERATTVRLAVPLDGDVPIASKRQATTTVHGSRKLLRRDSLDRREAVLKGKEGSRARRRWENDRLLNNPHAEPPLPSDWEIRPTYPRRTIPYYLAPLWDAAEFQRAIESKLNSKRKRRHNQQRRRHGKNGSVSSIDQVNLGISPMEEAASNIPKEIRARLKHARSAKGLLQDLEEDVRSFVRRWNERELKLREEGLGDAPLPIPQSLALRMKEDSATRVGARGTHGKNDFAIVEEEEEDDEEDEEIVFVGRNGAMHDMPSSPARSAKELNNVFASGSHDQSVDTDEMDDGEKVDRPLESTSIMATEKLIFQALESDKGAGFARWLVHCVGSYYGLRTWSITRDIDGQLRREAYVGIDSRARGLMGLGRCIDLGDRKEVELPQPLWGMV